jgi:hypothetical protein
MAVSRAGVFRYGLVQVMGVVAGAPVDEPEGG